ncbi:nuclear factor Y [Striga asiatica]|uniref:Nuclear factor Y n=1 Tax=Striga asiatica TaxID=4170 RepID=A0A5A7PMM9_STRAF|nr:nuclear factor Y [Striga asiatica]
MARFAEAESAAERLNWSKPTSARCISTMRDKDSSQLPLSPQLAYIEMSEFLTYSSGSNPESNACACNGVPKVRRLRVSQQDPSKAFHVTNSFSCIRKKNFLASHVAPHFPYIVTNAFPTVVFWWSPDVTASEWTILPSDRNLALAQADSALAKVTKFVKFPIVINSLNTRKASKNMPSET